MNRTRLLYRALLAGSLLALGVGLVLAVVGTDLRWAVATVALGLMAAAVASHLRLRVTVANDRLGARSLAVLHTKLDRLLPAAPAPASPVQVVATHDGGESEALALEVRRLGEQLTRLQARAYDAESAAIDAEHAALGVRDAVTRSFEHERSSRRYVLGSIDRLRALVEELPSAAGEYANLRSQLIDSALPMPQLGGWALTSRVVDAVAREVLTRDHATTVVELGSGGSSTWIGAALRANPHGGRCTSLEHLEEFAQGTRRSLVTHGLEDVVEVRVAPLEQHRIGDEDFEWYSAAAIPADLPPVDLLLVDGPPNTDNPMTRYPALPLLRERLAPGAAVVLDDTVRPEERAVVDRWLEENPELTLEQRLGKAVLLRWQPLR